MKNRKVIHASFHQGLFIPGCGFNLENKLPSQSKTFTDLAMYWEDQGLRISFTYKFKKVDILVPSANVALTVLDPEQNNES